MKNLFNLTLIACLCWIIPAQAQLNSVTNPFPENKCVQCDYAEITPQYSWPSPKANPSNSIKYSMITTGTPFGNPNSTPHAVSLVTAGQLGAPTPLFGNTMYRYRLNNTGTSDTRSEHYWGVGGTDFTDARWFMAAIYIPNSVCFDQRPFGLGFDFKHADAQGPAALNLKTPNGRWEINLDFPQGGGERKWDIGAIEKGKWIYVLIERNFEDDASGFIRVYMWTQGTTPVFTQKLQILGPNYHEYQGENTEGYVLWGPYIWLASGNEGSGACDEGGFKGQASYTFYYDNIIIAKSTATLTDFNNFISGATTPSNQAPSVNAGPNQTITLPDTDAALDGTVSDADGTIEGNIWTQVSGPNTATMSNAGLVDQTVSGLVAGAYVFRLTSTDDDGASNYDEVLITVVTSTPPPTATPIFTDPTCTEALGYADCPSVPIPDKTIYTPRTGDTLTFRAAHKNGETGYIQIFNIVQLTGPNTSVINTTGPPTNIFGQTGYLPTELKAGITNLIAGTYTYKVTATDNAGTSKLDTFSLIVLNAANTLPAVNAGSDILIGIDDFGQFITRSTTLNGTATDADGIQSVQWVKMTGDDNISMSAVNSLTNTISYLTAGTYTFRLRATDNLGGSNFDDVNVTILAANAGVDAVVLNPATTYNLIGTTSNVSDTSSVVWTQITGPTTATMTQNRKLNNTVGNLAVGKYTFRLTVTYNTGQQSRSNIEITVMEGTIKQYNVDLDIN